MVIVLNGRMAGKKGLVVKTFDEGTDGRKYGHAIVAGIARAPLKVKKSMSEKKVEKRSRVKPFLKLINFNHLMPTRCASIPPRGERQTEGERTVGFFALLAMDAASLCSGVLCSERVVCASLRSIAHPRGGASVCVFVRISVSLVCVFTVN